MKNLPLGPLPPPMKRRPFFWVGLCMVVFTGWLWADSLRYTAYLNQGEGCGMGGTSLSYSKGILRLNYENAYLPGLPGFPSNQWAYGRNPLPSSMTALSGPGGSLLKPEFHYITFPAGGITGRIVEASLPAWMPLGVASAGWGLLIFFAILRRRRAMVRLDLERAGVAPVSDAGL